MSSYMVMGKKLELEVAQPAEIEMQTRDVTVTRIN
jgi:hypothetical protein